MKIREEHVAVLTVLLKQVMISRLSRPQRYVPLVDAYDVWEMVGKLQASN